MAFFMGKEGAGQGAQDGAPRFDYYPPDGNHVVGMPVKDSENASKTMGVAQLNVGDLIGATAFDSATYKGRHLEADVFAELSNSMSVIEEKFHAGMYDAQAMPLVEAFLNELHELANIQVERRSIDNSRISDLKEANRVAHEAVFKARSEREMGIEAARLASLDYTTPDYEEIIAHAEEKRRIKAAKKASRLERKESRQRARLEKRDKDTEERRAARSKRAERQKALYLERQKRKHEKEIEKHQVKMEKLAIKKCLARQQVQQKLDELKRMEIAQEAQERIMRAQATTDAELMEEPALAVENVLGEAGPGEALVVKPQEGTSAAEELEHVQDAVVSVESGLPLSEEPIAGDDEADISIGTRCPEDVDSDSEAVDEVIGLTCSDQLGECPSSESTRTQENEDGDDSSDLDTGKMSGDIA